MTDRRQNYGQLLSRIARQFDDCRRQDKFAGHLGRNITTLSIQLARLADTAAFDGRLLGIARMPFVEPYPDGARAWVEECAKRRASGMPSIPRTPARPESVDGGACLAWLNMLLIPSLVRRYPHRFEHGADALHAQKASGETQNDKLAWLRARARNYADVATLLGELVEAVRAKNVAPKRPRGRPRIDEKKHDRIVKGWNPKQYPTYQDYANALGGGVTAKDVQRAVNREKKRRAAE